MGGEKGIEVLLVESRRKQGRWLFPKGGVKKSEKANEAAVRETYEESGVRGKLIRPNIGVWDVNQREKHKMWVLKVKSEEENYPEANERSKKWFTVEEARNMLKEKGKDDSREVIILEILEKAISQ